MTVRPILRFATSVRDCDHHDCLVFNPVDQGIRKTVEEASANLRFDLLCNKWVCSD